MHVTLFLFLNYRIRSSWEVDFIKAKSDADQQAPPNTKLAPPISPVPQIPNDLSAEFNFVQSMILQSGRPGTEVRLAKACTDFKTYKMYKAVYRFTAIVLMSHRIKLLIAFG